MTPITSLPACSRLMANALQVRFNLPEKVWVEERRWCDFGPEAGSADDHRADNDEQVFALVWYHPPINVP